MNKTKQKILDVSKNLFNEHGFSHVTIRMIAIKMEISSGNLNYHFKKREEILEALYFEMVETFDNRIRALSHTKISFPQILKDIQLSMERMLEYKFIWTDLFNILRTNEKISKHFYVANSARLSGNKYLFDQLNTIGLMRSSSFEREYDMLAERMINFGDTWIYTSEVYMKKPTKKYVKQQSQTMFAMLYPYLTTKGVIEFKKVIPGWFTEVAG